MWAIPVLWAGVKSEKKVIPGFRVLGPQRGNREMWAWPGVVLGVPLDWKLIKFCLAVHPSV